MGNVPLVESSDNMVINLLSIQVYGRPCSRFLGWLLIAVILIGISSYPLFADTPREQFPAAPDFPRDLPWLNVSEPLSLQQLRGKVVVLDFWTYGCINCLHVADELRELEAQFGDLLVVVGVHSPKFDNEHDLSTLERNIIRYELHHPVVQDIGFRLMEAYGARAWPTLAVIDPKGNYVARLVGEGVKDRLERIIDYLILRDAEVIDPSPLSLSILRHEGSQQGLAGPGKVAASKQIVAISDTLRHRVIIADRNGKVLSVFGGKAGFADGDATGAGFRSPQGVLISGDQVFVADAGNHAIRLIDLETGRVSTLAGTGEVGRRLRDTVEGTALELELRSPWALAKDGKDLYVAMAGSHQIWKLDLMRGLLSSFAGSGREGIVDGPVKRATFSQPSGLVLVGRDLYVADAEASAIRRVDIDAGKVDTLVGTGLFDFGDKDGSFEDAQLQHPGGIAALGPTSILVADSYNHKLRRLDLEARQVETLTGKGIPGAAGRSNTTLTLNEPSGVAVSDEFILVADTNHDRLLSYDLERAVFEVWPLDWSAVSGSEVANSADNP